MPVLFLMSSRASDFNCFWKRGSPTLPRQCDTEGPSRIVSDHLEEAVITVQKHSHLPAKLQSDQSNEYC